MKRILLTLLVIAVCISGIAASPLLQIGGYAAYNSNVLTIDKDEALSMNSFTIGPELRLNLFCLQLDVPATIGFTTKGNFTAGLLPSLNINASITDAVSIAIGMGLQMEVSKTDDGWYINGTDIDTFSNTIMGMTPFYRLGLTVNVKSISIGLSLSAQSKGSLESLDLTPDLDQIKGSVSVLFNFF